MKSFIDAGVEEYLYAMLPPRPPVLAEMERQAKERDIPIVGPAVARVLYQYAKLVGAQTVFEMGSAIGYSTIWWALAVGESGCVIYTDGSEKNAREAEMCIRDRKTSRCPSKNRFRNEHRCSAISPLSLIHI